MSSMTTELIGGENNAAPKVVPPLVGPRQRRWPEPIGQSADPMTNWWPALLTVAVLGAYELALFVAERARPGQVACSSHAQLREAWLDAIAQQPGSEILAVQTLRNSMMSATMTASTAALGLMGTATLAAPSLREALVIDLQWAGLIAPRPMLELVLLALLFISLVASGMAVRYYTHVSFIAGMPADSPTRLAWLPTGRRYIRQAGRLYGWGLRHLVLVAPVVAALLHPLAGPPAALLTVVVLFRFDRV